MADPDTAPDPVAYLTARLDEDEAAALAMPPSPWTVDLDDDEQVTAADGIEVCTAFALSNNQARLTAIHIARWDPAAVLADIAAKRAILALWATYWGTQEDLPADPWRDDDRAFFHRKAHATVLALAQPYAARPDFPVEWKIDA